MAGGSHRRASPFSRDLRQWQHVGGGIDSEGRLVEKPWALVQAELVLGLCERFHCLPSQLYREDAHELLRMLTIAGFSRPQDPSGPMSGAGDSELFALSDLTKTLE